MLHRRRPVSIRSIVVRRAFGAGFALALALLLVAPGALADAEPSAERPAARTAARQPAPAPGQQQTVVGDVAPIHDPAIIRTGRNWYVFSTGLTGRQNGGTIQISVSEDGGTSWHYQGTVWNKIPAWIDRRFADGALPDNLWAPDIHQHAGVYYLYYSASRFGTDDSVTALATNTTLDPSDPAYRWVDRGPVVSSPVTGLDAANPDKTFNAIDANLIEDADGKPYLAIGSFWYGIFLVPLSWPSGMPVAGWQSKTVNLADRFMPGNPIEAPFIVHRNGWFYLFVSFDFCCRGADSTYKIAVGRSRSLTGPYLDEKGADLYGGGGTVIMSSHGAMVGTGGQSVYGDRIAYHYYDAGNTASPDIPTLAVQRIDWQHGWPVLDRRAQPPTTTKTSVQQHRLEAAITVTGRGIPAPLVQWQRSTNNGHTWGAVAYPPRTERRDTSVSSRLEVPVGRHPVLYRAQLVNAHGSATTTPVIIKR